MEKKYTWSIFLCLIVSTFLGFILYPLSGSGNSIAQNLFAKGSYYFLIVMLLTWVYSLQAWYQANPKSMSKEVKMGALFFALILAIIVWMGVEKSFKVLSDEANLISVSQSLSFSKTAYNHTMGRWYYDNFWPITFEIDKRPLLYPFLVSIFHSVLGYSINNAFLCNTVVLFLLLFLVFNLVYPIAGFLGGLAAMLFVIAQPIICITAVSGGFDLLACLLQIWIMFLVLELCRKENTWLRPLIWSSLILLCHTRYEKIIAIPIVFAWLVIFKKLTFKDLKEHRYFYAFSFLFFLPRIWQLMVPQNYENPKGVPVVGWVNFVKHFPIFIRALFNIENELPYATLLNIACLIIIALWCGWLLKNGFLKKFKTSAPFIMVTLSFVFAELGISISHHFGVFDHPTQSRLFVLFLCVLSLSPFLLRWVLGYTPSKLLALAAAGFFIFYFPIAEENRFVNKLTLIRKTHWVYDFLANVKTKDILLISDRPGIYTIAPVGSVDFKWAIANHETIRNEVKRHLYQAVYVVEDIHYDKEKESELKDVFPHIETILERQNSAEEFVRIGKVIF